MYGGVAGESGRPLPLCRLAAGLNLARSECLCRRNANVAVYNFDVVMGDHHDDSQLLPML